MQWRFGSYARRVVVVDHAVVVGHGQATFLLIRSHSVGLSTSQQSGHVLSTLNEKERNSCPIVLASLIDASFHNRCSLFLK